MKLARTLFCTAVISACAISCWGISNNKKVAIVISVKGDVKVHHSDSASVQEPVRLLGQVYEKDDLTLTSGSQLTISVLTTGTRYTIRGPYKKLTVPGDGLFKVDNSSITEVKETGSRGMVASERFNHALAGGGSSRVTAIPILTDLDQPLILVSKFRQLPTGKSNRVPLWYSPGGYQVGEIPWKRSTGTIVTLNGRSFLKPDRTLPPGQSYFLSLQESQPKETDQPEIVVTRYEEADLKGIHQLNKSPETQQDWVELYDTYVELHLFERARATLAQMKSVSPNATDWNKINEKLDTTQAESEKHKDQQIDL